MAIDYKKRIAALRKAMKAEGLDAMIVSDRHNTRWLSGFAGSHSIIVLDSREARFITDARYGEAAEKSLDGFTVLVQPKTKIMEYYRDAFKKGGYGNAGFEGSISVDQHDSMKRWTRGTKLKKAGELILDLRAVKDEEELKLIRKAVKLADKMMAHAISLLKPGRTEAEISREIRFASETLGGEGESFGNIVASGPNSSSPHHHPSKRKLKKGDPVTIDLGGVVDGYCSDLTRNPVLGKPSKRFEEIYEICLRANEAAIKAVKAGVTGGEVDAVAREIIATAGYGDYFGHGLGHGVGLEVHEAPSLSPRSGEDKLKAGNIVTIEPGIYLPGVGGVRIEDYVLVTAKGATVLSKAPKKLQVLPA